LTIIINKRKNESRKVNKRKEKNEKKAIKISKALRHLLAGWLNVLYTKKFSSLTPIFAL
jgi:hypothetical protein